MKFRMRLNRRHALLVGIAFVIASVAALSLVLIAFASVHGRVEVEHVNHVWVREPVSIHFDQAVDTSKLRLTVNPVTPVRVKVVSNEEVVITPVEAWLPARHYQLKLADLPNSRHSTTLKGWEGTFQTQDRVAVSAFKLADQPASSQGNLKLREGLKIEFAGAMKPASVALTVNGQPAEKATLSWASDGKSAVFKPSDPVPAQVYDLVVKSGYSQGGDPLIAPSEIKLTVMGLEPSNASSGITANFKTAAPLQIVIEDSGDARPQHGLQQADIVYEYISEYNVNRFTAMYFNNPPALIGPVRSCRLINPPLNFAFHGFTMCSGASVGTLHFMFDLKVPAVINDFDTGNHFMRVGFKAAPHNLYTTSGRAPSYQKRLASLPAPPYTVDPSHPDNELGTPAAAPSVPLQHVTYSYNAASRTYARFDHGGAFIDAASRTPLRVKTVILIQTPYSVKNYVEDDNGGARSVQYFRFPPFEVESGTAQIYSDGKMINATWHMGPDWPMFFTDAQGKFIELNTGLTWIHVIGIGQRQ